MGAYIFDTLVFLNLLELLTILLVISSIFQKFGTIDRFTIGGIIILLSGVLGVIKTLFFSRTENVVVEKIFTLLIFLLLAVGISNYSKKRSHSKTIISNSSDKKK